MCCANSGCHCTGFALETPVKSPCTHKEIKVFLKLGRTECYLVSTLLRSIVSLKFSLVWCECVDMTCVGQHLNDICKAEWQSKIFKTL